MTAPVIVWLRRDLRLADQPAFSAAGAGGAAVVPVYILDDDTPGRHRMGGASRWWLHHSLASLADDLAALGSRLILRRGASAAVLRALADETGASAVHAIAHHEPWWVEAERQARDALPAGTTLHLHHGNYLTAPGSVTSGSGGQYKIYTPYWRALLQQMPPPAPLDPPGALSPPAKWPPSDDLANWALLPTSPDWATGFGPVWQPGEAGAAAQLERFVDRAARYDMTRNLPSEPGSSSLSPHLHFGELSAAQVWHRLADAGGGVQTFLGELGWRDYGQSIIRQFPDYATRHARGEFARFPWRDPASDPAAAADLVAWQQGRTGYPIVDAGMRQLWAIGWMHNRVRMIAASFLVKHLLIDWRQGEAWFWNTLVDADYASNAINWQWIAGSGVDSNMFVRIMAPITQSEKFGAGDYIRQWVPELAGVRDTAIHDPDGFGVRPRGYPAPRIGHREARSRALAAHARMKGAAGDAILTG